MLNTENNQPGEKLADSIIGTAKTIGVSRSTIYREIKSGRLKVTKIGKRAVILAEDRRAWLESLRASPPSRATARPKKAASSGRAGGGENDRSIFVDTTYKPDPPRSQPRPRRNAKGASR